MARHRRLAKENANLENLTGDDAEFDIMVLDGDELNNYAISKQLPQYTPYGDNFIVYKASMPAAYPFLPPKIKLLSKVSHMNIDEYGNQCIDILGKDFWSPALQLKSVIVVLFNLFKDPNPYDPLDLNLSKMSKEDPKYYNEYIKRKCDQNLRIF